MSANGAPSGSRCPRVFGLPNLLQVLNRLVEAGNTVLIIEHNLDVIKARHGGPAA
ncbi:hypothetical protein [Archangium sp.]|uniref:hypothetical protein n=1 Tax=Archangium sp. TaxID=1872627 RepID=UPI003899BF7C